MQRLFQLVLILLLFVGCSLRKRGLETPVPNNQVIEKSFFFHDGDPDRPKRFILGVAPIQTDASGEEWETFLAQDNLHVNVEFQQTLDKLVGLEVNPSFPNDRSKWTPVITIDILKHFYYEYRKDEYGRNTRELIQNDQRSYFARRTHMLLNLAGTRFTVERKGNPFLSRSTEILSSDNEEWDPARSFLGFNLNARLTYSYGTFVRNTQITNATRRVNLLAYEPDQNFKATPYHVDNANYFNVLHTVSRQVEQGGSKNRQIMKAARWDFSKTIDIYLDGVPEKYVSLFQETVSAWEDTLKKIEAVPANKKIFNVRTDYPSKYPFDLRYPAIHWIDSKRTSVHSPLGIALNNADTESGKMIAANVIIYGGLMEDLINRYFSTSIANSSAFTMGIDSLIPQELTYQPTPLPDSFIVPASLTTKGFSLKSDNLKFDALKGAPTALSLQKETEKFLSHTAPLDVSQMNMFATNKDALLVQAFSKDAFDLMENDPSVRGATNVSDHLDRTFSRVGPQWVGGLDFAKNAGITSVTQRTALRSLIRNVVLHELGHFLGLGHQFKGTVVPEYGTVPSEFTNHSKNLNKPKSLYARSMPSDSVIKCREKKHALDLRKQNDPDNQSLQEMQEDCVSDYIPTNYTSIMDYMNGRAEVLIPEKDVLPGPHDELVLRYIYKGEIATYNQNKDKFEYAHHEDVDAQYTGLIPSEINGNPVAYFPACNDYDASLMKDPYCNRWDAGSKAVDIVDSYLHNIDDNINNILFNFTDATELSAAEVENREWNMSIDAFSHIRPFYEVLRLRLLNTKFNPNDKNSISMWETLKNDEEALFSFSASCDKKVKDIANPVLKVVLADEQIRDLCLANRKVLDAAKRYASLPPVDHTILDENRVIQGGYTAGEGNIQWSTYVNGKAIVLSNLPLKIVSLLTATTQVPFMSYNGYMMSNIFYNVESNRFLYRTLYPFEVTDLTSATVTSNMIFASERENIVGSQNKTLIGNSILSMSYFNMMMNSGPYAGNEISGLSDSYNDNLQSQTSFDFSYAAILITVKPQSEPGADPDRYKKFTVLLYDFSNNKTISVDDFYILPERKIVVRVGNMFLFPVTKMRFYSPTEAYALAYKIGYDELKEHDPLYKSSVKTNLKSKYDMILNSCISPKDNSGLSGFFGGGADSTFIGFKIPQGIDQVGNKDALYEFEDSITKEFIKYEAYAKKKNPNLRTPMANRCEEVMRGAGMISSVAGMLNGFWLGITNRYVER